MLCAINGVKEATDDNKDRIDATKRGAFIVFVLMEVFWFFGLVCVAMKRLSAKICRDEKYGIVWYLGRFECER